MVKVNLYGAMKVHMTETFIKIIFMVQESTFGLMEEFTKVNGLITKWKVKELSRGVMDVVM